MPRPGAAWYRADRDKWYTKIHGKPVYLGVKGKGNRSAAEAARAQLIAGRSPPPPPAPTQPPPTQAATRSARSLAGDIAFVLEFDLGLSTLVGQALPAVGDVILIPANELPDGVARECEVIGRRWRVVGSTTGGMTQIVPFILTRTLPPAPAEPPEPRPRRTKR